MNELEKLKMECRTEKEFLVKSNKFFEDILSYDFYNYKLENLAKKIKLKNYRPNLKICNQN